MPPSAPTASIALRALALAPAVASPIGTIVTSSDAYVTTANASPGSSASTSFAAAAFACAIQGPVIEPDVSMTIASATGGRTWAPAAGTVIVIATSLSPAVICREVARAVRTSPSSARSAVGAGPGEPIVRAAPGIDAGCTSMAARTVAPAAPRASEVRARDAKAGIRIGTPELPGPVYD